MRPINLMSPEGAVIIRTLSNEATFPLCNHDNHSGGFKKRALSAVGGHIPCGPAGVELEEVEKDKAHSALRSQESTAVKSWLTMFPYYPRHVAVLTETIKKGIHDADSEARSIARK